MNKQLKMYFAIMVLFVLVAPRAVPASDAETTPGPATGEKKVTATFPFDSVWFYRDGTRVIPEIGKRWLTVVFAPVDSSAGTDFGVTNDSLLEEQAKAVLLAHERLSEYLYDPNLAEGAYFFKLRDGLKIEEIGQLINQLNRDKTVRYAQPTVVIRNKTFAFFDVFQMEWKTGIDQAQREELLSAAHVRFDEKENHYVVDVTLIPYFKALNLLAEDIRVRRAIPYLVEIKPSISASLSLLMSGGNIGDSIPFTLTIAFSDRISIDPSSIATLNLRPSNLQKELFDCTFDPYDYAKAVTKSPIVITGQVKFFAPGEFTIPPVTLSYTCPSCPDKTVRTIDTAPVIAKISSIIPADQSEFRLIVPADPLYPDYRLAGFHQQSLRLLWLAISSFAGLVLCAAWLLRMRHKGIAERDRPKEQKKDELLAERLRTLLHTEPAAPHWSYLGEAGSLLREYLVVLYGVDLKYRGGSGTQFMETLQAHLPQECVEPLNTIFTAIDASVSLELEQYQDLAQLQSEILKVVELTAHNSAARG